ncbi:MAG: DUF2139 domain-containing protein, partial [Desulfurococcales archaeon]|nr:DUF2139 domain-containing protein [Desulfurococcales archaeon]
HVYDTREQAVRLLWKESIHDPRYWAGEVSEVLYDPIEDLIYIARGDGHDRLGVYTLTREARAERVAGEPVLKGAIHLDHACFTLHGPGEWHPFRGITCIELGTRRRVTAMFNPDTAPSPDGHGVDKPRAGSVSSVYTRLAVMVRGGLVYGDPLSGEDLTFYRLLDFYPSHYGPLRVNTVIVSGAPLTAWNMMTHSTVVGSDEMVSDLQRRSRDLVAPSLLVYFDGPTPRIVGSMGARVTSIEVVGGEVLIGSSTAPNLERYDVTRLDAGVRSLNLLSLDSILTSNPPPVTIRPPRESYAGARAFGGVPLRGYRRPIIRVKSRGGGRLTVYSYMIGDPPGSAEADTYTLEEGWNTIDLSGHHGYIVSFSVEARADDVRIMLS